MTADLLPVVLAGGSGSRLWPLSRKLLPKQFLPIVGERTLLQETIRRLQALPGAGAPMLVCNEEHRFLAAEQLREAHVKPFALVLEPVGRNTAPAIAAAAMIALRDGDPLLFVLPSDHVVLDDSAFAEAVAAAAAAAAEGYLATFGIQPDSAATGYGYIEAGEPLAAESRVLRIRRFVEKPDAATASRFLSQGGFFWNSGMFLFRASRYLEELRRLRPDIVAAVEAAVAKSARDLDFLRLDAAAFAACPSDSVDYAVMEHTKAGVVVKCDMRWSDVGSWSALWAIEPKDADGNATRGDVSLKNAAGCYVRAGDRHVSVLGARDLVIVETDDAVLVADRHRAEQVKEIVEGLGREQRTEHLLHSRVYRPWGYYERVDGGERFQVKRLVVKPGHSLSLQLHRHRAEHWVVVSGTARVTRNNEVLTLEENQSTYIPSGTRHRLENPGPAALHIVEVQSGEYLGEDDIERFDDRYGR